MDEDQRIAELKAKIAELEGKVHSAGEAAKYQEHLEFLANTALDFLGQTDHSDIFEYIGNILVSLINDAIVIVNSFDEAAREFRTVLKLNPDHAGARRNLESLLRMIQ